MIPDERDEAKRLCTHWGIKLYHQKLIPNNFSIFDVHFYGFSELVHVSPERESGASLKFIEFVQRQKIIYSVILPSRTIQIKKKAAAEKAFNALAPSALEWLNISSWVFFNTSCTKVVLKLSHISSRRPEGACTSLPENNDWFDCLRRAERISGLSPESRKQFNSLWGVFPRRWREKDGNWGLHIFMSTHGDPFEFVFTTDSLSSLRVRLGSFGTERKKIEM